MSDKFSSNANAVLVYVVQLWWTRDTRRPLLVSQTVAGKPPYVTPKFSS
ncbi:MAG TPA: hypothetical protein VFR94_03745 [Nitrososphaeraceae archaeon]|nr:hypothetical protein [Nitrososphaeraceae archaeon]